MTRMLMAWRRLGSQRRKGINIDGIGLFYPEYSGHPTSRNLKFRWGIRLVDSYTGTLPVYKQRLAQLALKLGQV